MKRLWISGCAGLAFLLSVAIFPAFSDEAGAKKKAAASAKAGKTAPDEGGPPKTAVAVADEGGPPKKPVVSAERAVYSEDNAVGKTVGKSAAKKKSSKSAKKDEGDARRRRESAVKEEPK